MRRAFILNDTTFEHHHGCYCVMDGLRAGLSRNGYEIAGTLPVGIDSREIRQRESEVCETDLVVINGEGTLHSDRPQVYTLLEAARSIARRGIDVALVNALWQNNGPRAVELLSHCRFRFVRDRRSQRELSAAGVDVQFVPDLTFSSSYPAQRLPGELTGVIDSCHWQISRELEEACRRDDRLVYLPIVTYPRSTAVQTGSRLKAVKRELFPALYRRFPGQIPVRQHYRDLAYATRQSSDYRRRLAECRRVVSGRFHGVCFCLQQQIPFRAISSNTHKIEALLEDVGLERERFLLPDFRDERRFEEALHEDWTFTPAESSTITHFLDHAQKSIGDMFGRITGHNIQQEAA